ncbi:MAG: Sec-independent protein translocase protein TatB [Thiobacillaceae bacterium]|nr:Sec-independent protein translocase protein TatB [Thiobacillaceae bacterium]MDW8322585.1 Sec-independent protein translocase protein TatB [Burkholderiales bacterium]
MFDIGFSELLVIGVVALIVIGPERLPKLARTAGAWLGRLNRYVAQVKQDIDRDLKLEELKRLQQEMRETAQRYEILAEETRREIEQEADAVKRVVAAMSATDQGLTQRAYDELMGTGPDATKSASAEPVPDAATGGSTGGTPPPTQGQPVADKPATPGPTA